MTTATDTQLPQGIGRLSRGWIAFFLGAAVLFAFGIVGYIYEQGQGMVATGMRDLGAMQGATWGLYIAMVVYFIGVSFAGVTVAALIRLFDIEKLKGVARMAEVLTIVALVLGALAILVDLGQPLRGIVNLFRYGRPQSPFFGTFSLVVSGYLFASLVYLYVTSRPDAARLAQRPSRLQGLYRWIAAGWEDTPEQRAKDRRVTFWLAITILPLLVVAHSTLGFVFGLQVGRPGWFSTLQAPAFVTLAGVSGIGHIIVLAAIVATVLKAKDRIRLDAFIWLGRFLMVLLFVYLYFTIVELLTTMYQPTEHEKVLSDALLRGEYAWIFWGSLAGLAIPALMLAWMALTRHWRVSWLVVASILVNLAAIGKRYLIVVPSQTHGQLLPYGIGSYSPSWVEYAVVIGLFGLGALAIGAFMKLFPIIELEEGEA
ncbi:MAG: molybdopterin oxidoreductase [Acidimicrobiia bacterium]|nr:MAG: molybdopterin oxidoreductase [Acidimicrobiia bacterium]